MDFRPVRLRELTFWEEKLISMSCLTTPTILISERIKITVMSSLVSAVSEQNNSVRQMRTIREEQKLFISEALTKH